MYVADAARRLRCLFRERPRLHVLGQALHRRRPLDLLCAKTKHTRRNTKKKRHPIKTTSPRAKPTRNVVPKSVIGSRADSSIRRAHRQVAKAACTHKYHTKKTRHTKRKKRAKKKKTKRQSVHTTRSAPFYHDIHISPHLLEHIHRPHISPHHLGHPKQHPPSRPCLAPPDRRCTQAHTTSPWRHPWRPCPRSTAWPSVRRATFRRTPRQNHRGLTALPARGNDTHMYNSGGGDVERR